MGAYLDFDCDLKWRPGDLGRTFLVVIGIS
jgi:hypothetical protein